MTEDFYDLLDVPADASQDEIKTAYREQVRVYHPDHNDDDRARAQFTAVKKAYDILGDPVERQAYDRLGHEDYVAKRTSGLPSADVWQSSDSGDETSDADEEPERATATAGAGSGASAAGESGSTSTTDSRSSTGASAGAASSASTAGSSASAGTTSSSNAAGTSGTTGTGSTGTRTAGRTTTGTTGTTGSTGTSASNADASAESEPGGFGDNAVVRWWRRQNFSLPLIWLSVVVYLSGLGHFASANQSGLEALRVELAAAGTDPDALATTLSSGRYGIDSSVTYLTAFELVAPPLEGTMWYAALAGAVGLTLLTLLGVRAYRDGDTWGPVSIDETIVVALAVTATTVLVGGPLLAGAVLMPMLFAVIVRHTRRGPGWKPSYLYVLPVLAPLVGFGVAAADAATLAVDLAALVVLPIVGGLGLPLRATIRKHFGW
ncbi:heat shock protein DnaJ domain protein [Haloterrigena turkmenica DSM 5511]|uniref:Heat shock protein DnaJ domain protein n=1 Tax=Haloterrigena turkmenica (strain ATCC 51198 / DSM 5511 / JCM 9101 / NCIMB 13204 / VKM B-1734 / 4k) TaxID=543526 RepID=D2RTA2_HALTV|nr:DnaJ domain-containing protein [Haloterrigena turkmenica]ADB60982.1 heat shock protein DnaJ domain protein [Haloterrigena turkmenica DSM 5511]